MSQSNDSAGGLEYWKSPLRASWVAEQARLDALFEPLSRAGLMSAAPRSGEHVLDVGCGCGATTLDLARAVGAAGRVVGVDISDDSLARARERVEEEGLADRITLLSADAQTCTFPEQSTDLVFSRLGVMFFADPGAAFRNLHRALKRGGRMTFVCLRTPEENPYISTPVLVARSLLPGGAVAPLQSDGVGMFSFALPKRVRPILEHGGFRAIEFLPHDVPMRLGGPGESAAAAQFSTQFGPMPRIMSGLAPDVQRNVLDAITDEYRRSEQADGIVLTGAFWIVKARA